MTAEELLNMVNDDIEVYQESKDEDYRAKAIWELALTGLSCLYMDVRKTDQTDQYGRAVYDIRIENVPSIEMYPDRQSSDIHQETL